MPTLPVPMRRDVFVHSIVTTGKKSPSMTFGGAKLVVLKLIAASDPFASSLMTDANRDFSHGVSHLGMVLVASVLVGHLHSDLKESSRIPTRLDADRPKTRMWRRGCHRATSPPLPGRRPAALRPRGDPCRHLIEIGRSSGESLAPKIVENR